MPPAARSPRPRRWRDPQRSARLDRDAADRSAASSTTRKSLPIEAGLAELLRRRRKDVAKETGSVPAAGKVFHVAKNLTEQIRKDARWAGIPVIDDRGRRLDLHALRATCATLLANAGVPLQHGQRLIRHTDSKLTAKHYEKVADEDLRPAVALVGAAFWRGQEVAPRVAPNSAPMRAAAGCSVPLAATGNAITDRAQVGSEQHAVPAGAGACRSVPFAKELWRRRESNPRPEIPRPGPLRA